MTTKKTVIVRGVRVHVRLDDKGQPLTAHARIGWQRIDHPGDPERERLVTLAATGTLNAFKLDRASLVTLATTRAVDALANSAKAARESARVRAEAAAAHWTSEWLALAHAANPKYGKDRLAVAARRLAAEANIEPDTKRDEISVKRARQFLARLRKQHR